MAISTSSNTIKSLYKSPIADIGPFLEQSRYNECINNLNDADKNGNSDGNLNEDEYAEFIRLYSYGYIDTTFVGLKDISLAFVSTYVSYSCNPTCNIGREDIDGEFSAVVLYSFNACCRGEESYIPLSALGSSDLFQLCAYTDQYIRGAVNKMDAPSKNPSVAPSQAPTAAPTNYPTMEPTLSPSMYPSTSIAPTSYGQTEISFSYVIRTNGYTSNMINESKDDDNSVHSILINATTAILTSILTTGNPCPLTRRKLAKYRSDYPVKINSVIDIRCPDNEEGTNCILVNSVVTVFCDRTVEDCYTMQRQVLKGLQTSFKNGCFFRVMSP